MYFYKCDISLEICTKHWEMKSNKLKYVLILKNCFESFHYDDSIENKIFFKIIKEIIHDRYLLSWKRGEPN